MASRKFEFAQKVQGYCTAVAQNADLGFDARTVYEDRGYASGGSDPITDSDVAGLEITAAELYDAMLFFNALNQMLTNQAHSQADYDATLNVMRDDL